LKTFIFRRTKAQIAPSSPDRHKQSSDVAFFA
jgi:hypothetical protein